MQYTYYKPPISLRPYIDRYWRCNSNGEKSPGLFPLFTGTGLDLFIHFSSPFRTEENILPTSHIFCPRKPILISSDGDLDFLAIRFRSGAFRHFCTLSFKEFSNGFLSFKDIWGNEGQNTEDKLQEELSWTGKIDILNDFFLKQFYKHSSIIPLLDHSISYIYGNHDSLSLGLLAKDLNISLRHFERLFKNEFNISPKKFQITSRFQATIKALLLSPDKDYLQIALNNGYFDQAHFIKECRLLSGMPPLEILKMKEQNAHFYFKSLP